LSEHTRGTETFFSTPSRQPKKTILYFQALTKSLFGTDLGITDSELSWEVQMLKGKISKFIILAAVLLGGASSAKDILLTDCETNNGVTRCTVDSASKAKRCCYFRQGYTRVLEPDACTKEGGSIGEFAYSDNPSVACKQQ
jgi:hypothetical protein